MGRQRRHSREVREEALRQLAGGVSPTEVGGDLGVPEATLREWRDRAGILGVREQVALSNAEQVELKQLRRENAQLRETQTFLKKAIAFFARASESDTP